MLSIFRHGNQARIWEDLIDQKKLPYLATIRNLRNLILSGISDSHVDKVCAYIQNEKAVGKSRMFPFRFYTAFDVLSDLEKFSQGTYKEPKKNLDISTKKMIATKQKKQAKMNSKAIKKLESALNNAIQVATQKNIPPLSGNTLLLTLLGYEMKYAKMTAAKTTKFTNALDVALLFSFMLESSCEAVTWKNLGSKMDDLDPEMSLLQKVQVFSAKITTTVPKTDAVFQKVFMEIIRENRKYDRIILVHGGQITDFSLQMALLDQYRALINPNCVYADINVMGHEAKFDKDLRNVYMCGFSETIFQSLANNSTMSSIVENVDKRYNLGTMKQNSILSMPKELKNFENSTSKHQIRIFVSSTFKDMHGERNIMNNYIFPELTKRAKSRNIELTFVDLRWGVHHGLSPEKQVEICLDEIEKSSLFIGILGERYGWKPQIQEPKLLQRLQHKIQDTLDVGNVSMTELEMLYNGLNENSFYFIRDHEMLSNEIPNEFLPDFVATPEDEWRLKALKLKVIQSGCQVMNDYPAKFIGVRNGVPLVGNLEAFGTRLLDTLWNALMNLKASKDSNDNNTTGSIMQKHFSFVQEISKEFIGKQKTIEGIHENIKKMFTYSNGGIIEVSAKEGFGSTSVLAKVSDQLSKNKKVLVLPYFADALGQKAKVSKLLAYLKQSLHELLGLEKEPKTLLSSNSNVKSLAKDVSSLLQNASNIINNTNFKLVVVIDGANNIEAEDGILYDWIPSELSKGIFLIISTNPGLKLSRFIGFRSDKQKSIQIHALDLKERKQIAINFMKKYGKTLNEDAFDNQLSALIMKRESGNPTFLKMLCLEMVKFGVFEQVSSHLQDLGESLDSLLRGVCKRVESDIPRKSLEKVIPFIIASSDYGISEANLLKLFNDQMNLSHLLNGLEIFMETNHEGKITIKSGKYFEILAVKYCPSRMLTEAHKNLAKLYQKEYENANLNLDVLEILPYHLSATNDTKQLEELICSLRFIQLSAKSARTFLSLQLHYSGTYLTSKVTRERYASSARVKAYSDFVIRYKDEMLSQPCLVPQLALNEPENSIIREDMNLDNLIMPNYILMNSDPKPSNLVSSRSFNNTITAFALEKSDELDQNDLLAAYGFIDGSITLSLSKSGQDLFSLLGHSCTVTAVAFLAGSKSSGDSFLVSGTENGDLNFWDLNQRIRIKSFEKAHSRKISGIAVSYDGLTVVSVGWDGVCKVWNGRGHRETSSLKTSTCPYNCVAYHPDKDYIITGDWDGLVKVWDLTSGHKKAVLRGHPASVQSVVISSDASRVISSDISGKICLFEGMYYCFAFI